MAYTYSYPRPMLTADCLVTNQRGEVLLIRRGHDPFCGCWALPGGFMEMEETLAHCAARELQEETGLEVKERELTLLGVYSDPYRDPRGRTVTAVYHIKIDTIPAESSLQAGDDAEALGWWPLSCLPSLAFDHRQIIDDYQRSVAVTHKNE